MNKPVQFHLLCVVDPTIGIGFEEKLNAAGGFFIYDQAVGNRLAEVPQSG
jgi:hypothetical protein